MDNPHTKPFAFWEWLISRCAGEQPESGPAGRGVHPAQAHGPAGRGRVRQSYTYFTWRIDQHGPEGLRTYVEELAHGPLADYMRPNFWPNTPDILSGPLRDGPPSAFALRFVLAATLARPTASTAATSCTRTLPASPDNEEYLDSEKYEIKDRDFSRPGSLAPLITTLNAVAGSHPRSARLRTSISMARTTPT